ncbi:MAG: T9SS type A sorting domain-containing protein [Prevotella sp.]|nr:T9SS type A sorting domain-containing protein [Prevotella sp.]
MAKKILPLFFMMFVWAGAPLAASASPAIEIIENDFQTITISVSDESVLHVTGAAGQALYIYNVTGVRVMSIKVDGSDRSYSLNLPKGCYIVKVGKVVRKISIR